MKQHIRAFHLFKSRAERSYQIGRQIANEPHSVIDDDLLVTRQQHACEIYQLGEPPPSRPRSIEAQAGDGGLPARKKGGLLQRLRGALTVSRNES